MKTFESVVPDPPPGSDWPTNVHPVQGFQWGDYAAKPGHDYTYAVSAVGGTAAAPVPRRRCRSPCAPRSRTTASTASGSTAAWRAHRPSRGSSPAGCRPRPPTRPTRRWSGCRAGSGRRCSAFFGEALDDEWSLRGALYELTWGRALQAFGAARDRGADCASSCTAATGTLRRVPARNTDRTAEMARAAVTDNEIEDLVTWRDGPDQERAAPPQVPRAVAPRHPRGGVDRLDQPHPRGGLRPLQRRPRRAGPGGRRPVRGRVGAARERHAHRRPARRAHRGPRPRPHRPGPRRSGQRASRR